jgi:hypothetical protein
MEYDDIMSDEWEEELGEAINENLDLSPIDDVVNDLIDYAQTAIEVVDIANNIVNGPS